jgi:hypothetical protein
VAVASFATALSAVKKLLFANFKPLFKNTYSSVLLIDRALLLRKKIGTDFQTC